MLLKSKLEKMNSILNKDNVLASLEERYCYAEDASNYKCESKIPDLVVFVETVEDVQKVLKYAYKHEIPVVSRGAGTNMVGACVCTSGGIVLNFSKMNKILELNKENMIARVEPGVILGDLKQEVDKLGLFYPPDPSNYRVSTVGGSIAQSSGGAMSFKYGTTKDYVLSLKVVTADGTLIKLGAETAKNSMGYHLSQLMVGSEGTLAVIVEATLKLIPKPEAKGLVLAYFSDIKSAVSAVNRIIDANVFPASIDFMDNNSIKTVEEFLHCGLDLENAGMLLIDLDGSLDSMNEQVNKVVNVLNILGASLIKVPSNQEEADLIWNARRASFAASTRLAPDVVSDDIIVPRTYLAEMIEYCLSVASEYSLKVCIVGHLGDGNIHPQFVLDLENEEEFRNYTSAKSKIYLQVLAFGGVISAEHGIGIEKKCYFEKNIDDAALDYMKLIKKCFDPKNILNPGKIFDL